MIIAKRITGWKWISLEDFQDSRAVADTHFGYPKEGCQTTSSMSPKESKDSAGNIQFYYVGNHPQLKQVLGEPIAFDINIEIPDPS